MYSLKEVYKIGRGPSSSHSMGPELATKDFLRRYPVASYYAVTLYGSLAMTGRGHLTDQAILSAFGDKKTEIVFDTKTKDLPHPNTMIFSAYAENGEKLGEILPFRGKRVLKRASIRFLISAVGKGTAMRTGYRSMRRYSVMNRRSGAILQRSGRPCGRRCGAASMQRGLCPVVCRS